MCTLKSLMSQVLSNSSIKVFYGTKTWEGGGDKTPTGPLLRRLCVAKNVKKKNVTEEFCSGFGMQLWHHYHVPFLCPRFTPQFLHFCDIFVSSKFEQVHFSFLSREVG